MRSALTIAGVALLAALAAGGSTSQNPAPGLESTGRSARAVALTTRGAELLLAEDPVLSLRVFRELREIEPDSVDGLVGVGRSHLLLGEPAVAERYAIAALQLDSGHDEALELEVRALLRGRQFHAAVARSTAALEAGHSGPGLLAAHASALFRVQRTDEASEFYRLVLEQQPDHAEAHLRLGSGLTAPRRVELGPGFAAAVLELRAGRLRAALAKLRVELKRDPGNPVLHRLIGESLFRQRGKSSMAVSHPAFQALWTACGVPRVDRSLSEDFMPMFRTLRGDHREVASRALALFAGYLPRLVTQRGRHDLILEAERTTDDPNRSDLRGKRTFDGRVWDDVRGIGGLRAATGIESLDDAAQYGFDTLAHEIAHQVHLYALPRKFKTKIRRLYDQAVEQGRCLDYYAASNYAEYFGQGVEAFISLAKRPSYEATHGHTRFELKRVDPDLYRLIESLVSHDPIGPAVSAGQRAKILRSAIATALRSGRPADAVTAAELLPPGTERTMLRTRSRRALIVSRSL